MQLRHKNKWRLRKESVILALCKEITHKFNKQLEMVSPVPVDTIGIGLI